MGWPAVIILHTVAGKPLGVRLGRDLIFDSDPMTVSIDGEKFEVRETKNEIDAIIRDV